MSSSCHAARTVCMDWPVGNTSLDHSSRGCGQGCGSGDLQNTDLYS